MVTSLCICHVDKESRRPIQADWRSATATELSDWLAIDHKLKFFRILRVYGVFGLVDDDMRTYVDSLEISH